MIELSEHEHIVLTMIRENSLTVSEFEAGAPPKISVRVARASLYTLLIKDVVKLDDELKLTVCVPASNLSVVSSVNNNNNKPKLERIDGGIAWRSDELLGWAFEQLEEFAQLGNFESIALAFRYTDHTTYAVFEGGDLIGLAGAASLLHDSIIAYSREE